MDSKIKTSVVAAREGVTTRTLYARIQAGTFPPPDFPSTGNGVPNYWLASTLEAHRVTQLQAAAHRPAQRRAVMAAE